MIAHLDELATSSASNPIALNRISRTALGDRQETKRLDKKHQS